MGIDFNRFPDDRPPAGDYFCRLVEAKPKNTSAGPAYALRFVVETGEWAGRVACFDNLISSEKGEWIARSKLKVLSVPIPGPGKPLVVEISDIIGKTVWLRIGTREYNGKTYNQPEGGPDTNFGYFAERPPLVGPAASAASSSPDEIPF